MLDKGELIQGRYRVEAPLGQGGMATVYRAVDKRLNVTVALKELIAQPGLSPQMLAALRAQFLEEARVLARLKHPSLVRVTDFFEDQGNAYLVMDFIEGQSLADYIKQTGPVSEEQVLAWAAQLLDALEYCHSQGILHRDIKPQNIILGPDKRLILVDFGLVKLWNPNDPRTKTAMRGMGTPEYAPPEQYDASSGHTVPSSDIYSLGATLYHALSGESPPTATMRIADPESFTRARDKIRGVSAKTQRALFKALELRRTERWATAGDMAEALGVQIRHRRPTPPPAPKPRPKPRTGKGLPRGAWVAGGATVLLLLAGGVVGFVNPGFLVSKPTPTPTVATPTVTPTATYTSMPTPTRTPTPTPTTRPTSTPIPMVAPELANPPDNQGYYPTTYVAFRWTWEEELTEDLRFVLFIQDETGQQLVSEVLDQDAGMEHVLQANAQGLGTGTYTWWVEVEREGTAGWSVVAQSEQRTFRVVPQPAAPPTDEATEEATAAPTEDTSGGDSDPEPPAPEPTDPPAPEPTEPPAPEPTEPPAPEPTDPPPPEPTEPPPPPPAP
jgi:serine/threonine-protein kinase